MSLVLVAGETDRSSAAFWYVLKSRNGQCWSSSGKEWVVRIETYSFQVGWLSQDFIKLAAPGVGIAALL